MKRFITLFFFILLVSLTLGARCCEAQAFHRPKYEKIQHKNAKRHGAKLFNRKVKQAAFYRKKRKEMGVQ